MDLIMFLGHKDTARFVEACTTVWRKGYILTEKAMGEFYCLKVNILFKGYKHFQSNREIFNVLFHEN